METEMTAQPPEAILIQRARKAAGLTAEAAAARVRDAGTQVSATYWRDVERGHGGRRGQRVQARASDRMLAQMARTLAISPERLADEGQRPDAAEVLREMLRREAGHDTPPSVPSRDRDVPVITAMKALPGYGAYREAVDAERDGGGFTARDEDELHAWANPDLTEDEKRTYVAFMRLAADRGVRSSGQNAGLVRA